MKCHQPKAIPSPVSLQWFSHQEISVQQAKASS